MIDYLKRLTPTHIWLLSFTASFAAMGGVAGGMGLLLKGEIAHDYLLVGAAASFVVACLAGWGLNSLASQQRKIEENFRRAASVIRSHGEDSLPEAAPAGETEEALAAPACGIAGDEAAEEQVAGVKGAQAGIKQAIGNLDVLPAMPVIAQKLLSLDLNTREGERMLLELIGQDPQISAKIVGLANSAGVGASRQIATVKDAVMLLGIKRVQSVATSIAILSLMAKVPAGEFNVQDLWLHSFRIAFAMQGVARFMPARARPQDDQIFLAGMLHDIGFLALAYLDPKLSDKLHTRLAAEPERQITEIEPEVLEIGHAELGAELARHWNLPEEIVAVLRYHHSPDAAGAAAGQPLVHMIDIAQRLLPPMGIIEHVMPDIRAEEWEVLGISPSRAEEVRLEVNGRAEQAAQFVGAFS